MNNQESGVKTPMNLSNKPPRPFNRGLAQVVDEELERVVPEKVSKWFGSLSYRPKATFFSNQNPEEKVYLLLRRHWIKNLGWIISNTFYAFVPIIILVISDALRISLDFISFKVYFIIILAYYSVILTNVLRNFYDWYFDIYIVTNERVLEYSFSPFVSYSILEAELESIQDVKESANGVVADIFSYGDLRITTASRLGELFFDSIPSSTEVRNILMDLVEIIDEYKHEL